MTLKRALNEAEELYIKNPRGMANMHWNDNAEQNNPYKLGTVECGEYIDEFHKLDKRFDFSR